MKGGYGPAVRLTRRSVNNAGVFEWCPLKNYELSNYVTVINVNQVGPRLPSRRGTGDRGTTR